MTREIISRALIIKGNRFLVCRRKGSGYWFFPGGHIDLGENAKEALARELKEERGSQVEISDFVGVIENFFKQDGKKISEINLIFLAREPEETDEATSKEDHLEFKFIELDDFEKENVLPFTLKGAITQWIQDGKPFYFTNHDDLSL